MQVQPLTSGLNRLEVRYEDSWPDTTTNSSFTLSPSLTSST